MSTKTKPTPKGAQHTPGPWVVRRDDLPKSKRLYICADGQGMVPLIGISDGNPGADANARLIAAAPELLEACKFALDWLARIDGSGCKGTDILLANAPEGNHRNLGELRAAIAKAERGAK